MIKACLLSVVANTTYINGQTGSHLLHVLKFNSTDSIKKEWIHVRWTKEYIAYQYEPDTNIEKIKLYQMLYDNHPHGIYFEKVDDNVPFLLYSGFETSIINDAIFQVPDCYQFL